MWNHRDLVRHGDSGTKETGRGFMVAEVVEELEEVGGLNEDLAVGELGGSRNGVVKGW